MIRSAKREAEDIAGVDWSALDQELQKLISQCLQACSELSLRDEKYATMAKLYAGAKRLHQAMKDGAVIDAIIEISSNLIGCEQLGLLIMRERGSRVALIGSEGLTTDQFEAIQISAKGIVERVSSVYINGETGASDLLLSSLGITACVPFQLDGTARGAIVFFSLLPQRSGLDCGDRELLKLLSIYAGPCLLRGTSNKELEILG